ncbi:hypothetical protein [Streptomyces hokutonensis]|uniref:hypothetical protein n=1 Tax=Streptomyces hokutonensis TaxID=1306990 RepID=UPI000368F49F|nr:hypothetical protein [Streptomyces hokutonensis]
MPPGQSKAELYAALRRDAREGMSNRAEQDLLGHGRVLLHADGHRTGYRKSA